MLRGQGLLSQKHMLLGESPEILCGWQKENREGLNVLNVTTLQAPLWAEPELTFLKSCLNVKQSRGDTNKNAPAEVVWQGPSMPQDGHILDRAGTG